MFKSFWPPQLWRCFSWCFSCVCFSVWPPQLWRCFSCVCFSPLVLTSVLRRKGGVHVHWLRLTGQCRDRIQRFFLCAPDVVLKTKYRMAAIDAQKMMWITNHLSERGCGVDHKTVPPNCQASNRTCVKGKFGPKQHTDYTRYLHLCYFISIT